MGFLVSYPELLFRTLYGVAPFFWPKISPPEASYVGNENWSSQGIEQGIVHGAISCHVGAAGHRLEFLGKADPRLLDAT